jgi:hypothetical protein
MSLPLRVSCHDLKILSLLLRSPMLKQPVASIGHIVKNLQFKGQVFNDVGSQSVMGSVGLYDVSYVAQA